eukprot:SAG31_NODE_144_length_22617_cov_21.520117_20_plen_146_part_00
MTEVVYDEQMVSDITEAMNIPARGTLQRTVNYTAIMPPAYQPHRTERGRPTNTVYNVSQLERSQRAAILSSIRLLAGETMVMNCEEEDAGECELCDSDDGCQFEEGSELQVLAVMRKAPSFYLQVYKTACPCTGQLRSCPASTNC